VGARAADSSFSDLPPTMLVVVDEILVRWVIAEHLRDCGYRVIETGSGDEALDVLRRTGLTVNVVFSDVRMPGTTDGFALAQWIQRERPGIKIVLTSGFVNASDASEALYDDAPLILKPYAMGEIKRSIETLLGR
jgi:DNA-binding NtrC family response regulator